MTEQSTPRYTLMGLGILGAVVLTAVFLARPVHADTTASKPGSSLQSLAELDGKAPSHRTLNIQTWNTSEGATMVLTKTMAKPRSGPPPQHHIANSRLTKMMFWISTRWALMKSEIIVAPRTNRQRSQWVLPQVWPQIFDQRQPYQRGRPHAG